MKVTHRRIPMKLSRLLQQLLRYRPQRVYLFGSYARGEADSLSDIDLVVVKETEKPFFDRIREVWGCLEATGPIDILVYTPSEFDRMSQAHNAFVEMLLEEGICVYDAEEAA